MRLEAYHRMTYPSYIFANQTHYTLTVADVRKQKIQANEFTTIPSFADNKWGHVTGHLKTCSLF